MVKKLKDSGIEWIGEIPEHWSVLPNKRIMEKESEICEKYRGEDILSLTMGGVIKRDLDNPKGKMPATFDGYQRIKAGNLLLCLFDIDVTPRCVGLIKDNGLTSPAYTQFRMKENNSARYYDYLLRMIDNDKCYLHLSKNLRSSLNETDFGMIKTIAPPIEEQEEIANYLDEKLEEIDSIIEKMQKSIDGYKSYKKSLIAEIVTNGLNKNIKLKDSGIEWIGEIPEHWSVLPNKRIMEKESEICEKYRGEDILSLTMGGVIKRDLDNPKGKMPATFDGYQRIKAGNLLLCLFDIDVTPRCVGLIKDNGLTSPAYTQFRMKENNSARYYDYLLRMIDNDKCYLHLSKNLRSSLNETDFGMIKTIVPPIEEQEEIANYLDKKLEEIDMLISKKQILIDGLINYKKSLIYECVTGKKEI